MIKQEILDYCGLTQKEFIETVVLGPGLPSYNSDNHISRVCPINASRKDSVKVALRQMVNIGRYIEREGLGFIDASNLYIHPEIQIVAGDCPRPKGWAHGWANMAKYCTNGEENPEERKENSEERERQYSLLETIANNRDSKIKYPHTSPDDFGDVYDKGWIWSTYDLSRLSDNEGKYRFRFDIIRKKPESILARFFSPTQYRLAYSMRIDKDCSFLSKHKSVTSAGFFKQCTEDLERIASSTLLDNHKEVQPFSPTIL